MRTVQNEFIKEHSKGKAAPGSQNCSANLNEFGKNQANYDTNSTAAPKEVPESIVDFDSIQINSVEH